MIGKHTRRAGVEHSPALNVAGVQKAQGFYPLDFIVCCLCLPAFSLPPHPRLFVDLKRRGMGMLPIERMWGTLVRRCQEFLPSPCPLSRVALLYIHPWELRLGIQQNQAE